MVTLDAKECKVLADYFAYMTQYKANGLQVRTTKAEAISAKVGLNEAETESIINKFKIIGIL